MFVLVAQTVEHGANNSRVESQEIHSTFHNTDQSSFRENACFNDLLALMTKKYIYIYIYIYIYMSLNAIEVTHSTQLLCRVCFGPLHLVLP